MSSENELHQGLRVVFIAYRFAIMDEVGNPLF